MEREEVKQRIRYLVEHGGLHEAPEDAALWVRLGVGLSALSCTASLMLLAMHI